MNALLDRLYICLLKQVRPYDKQGAQLWQSRRKLRNEILAYYCQHPSDNAEIKEALAYLKERPDMVYFPAKFREAYLYSQIDLGFDQDHTPYWTMPDGKRLYFLADEPDKVRMSINGLRIEQDKNSPHCYLTPDFCPGEEDVLVDVGSAEGILSLQYVDKVKRVYLFERDPVWINVLQKTFAPWAEKVKIIPKYVGAVDDENNVRLDTYFKQEQVVPTFIKMDVEGAEQQVLEGMTGLFETHQKMKIAACTYHLADEYRQLSEYVSAKGFRYETSKGLMLFNLYDKCCPPYFRHGLLRIWVNE